MANDGFHHPASDGPFCKCLEAQLRGDNFFGRAGAASARLCLTCSSRGTLWSCAAASQVPPDCAILTLARRDEDVPQALEALAEPLCLPLCGGLDQQPVVRKEGGDMAAPPAGFDPAPA
jgi:hypothetical protein